VAGIRTEKEACASYVSSHSGGTDGRSTTSRSRHQTALGRRGLAPPAAPVVAHPAGARDHEGTGVTGPPVWPDDGSEEPASRLPTPASYPGGAGAKPPAFGIGRRVVSGTHGQLGAKRER